MNFTLYLVLGIIWTTLMIRYYRRDGQTKKPGELYFAMLGILWF